MFVFFYFLKYLVKKLTIITVKRVRFAGNLLQKINNRNEIETTMVMVFIKGKI